MSNSRAPNNKKGFSAGLVQKYAKKEAELMEQEVPLDEQKSHLAELLFIPAAFKVSHSDDILTDPVLMPCGHLVNGTVIQAQVSFTCSIDNKIHSQNDFIQSQHLKKLVNTFHEERKKIILVINKLSEQKKSQIITQISEYGLTITHLAAQFSKAVILTQEAAKIKPQAMAIHSEIPDAFLDPIASTPLTNPVFTKAGYLFNVETIEQCVRQQGRCPISREAMTLATIRSNDPDVQRVERQILSVVAQFNANHQALGILIQEFKVTSNELNAYQQGCEEGAKQIEKLTYEARHGKSIKKLMTSYQRAGFPSPPLHPDEHKIDDEVLLEDGRWQSKAIASEQHVPFIEDKTITEGRRQQPRNIYELFEKIKSATTHSEANLAARINELKENASNLRQRAAALSQAQREIGVIINNLKIDWRKEEHLIMWDGGNNHCFHRLGGKQITFNDPQTGQTRKYRVPTRVKKLMEIASRVNLLEGKNAFLQKLELAKSHKPGFWNNPFSAATRKQEAKQLYDTENLQNIVISSRHR